MLAGGAQGLAVCWTGHQRNGDRRLLYPVLLALPMVMVAGDLISARGETRVLRGPGLG